jgi:hypothetical protein
MKTKFTHIKIPILNSEYWVVVIWGDPKKMWKFARKKYKDITIPPDWFEPEHSRGHVMSRKDYCPMIVMHIGPDDKHFWATLAHEAVHAIDVIWSMIEEHHHRHEVFAHSVGAVVAAVEAKLRGGGKY